MTELGTVPDYQNRLWQDSAFFSVPDAVSKICEKLDPDPVLLFHFGSCWSLWVIS